MRYYSGGYGRRFFAIPSALGWTWLLGLNVYHVYTEDPHVYTKVRPLMPNLPLSS
ncbi:unnamed protein product, partial [Ascophyllum nodosum]